MAATLGSIIERTVNTGTSIYWGVRGLPGQAHARRKIVVIGPDQTVAHQDGRCGQPAVVQVEHVVAGFRERRGVVVAQPGGQFQARPHAEFVLHKGGGGRAPQVSLGNAGGPVRNVRVA